MQLELSYWPRGCVRQVLVDYLQMKAPVLSEASLRDYSDRVNWLIEVLGPLTPAQDVTFLLLEDITRQARQLLKDVTIKRRWVFWRAAAKLAQLRGYVSQVAPLPPDLVDDGVRGGMFYTIEQWREFRQAVPPGRYRRFGDLGFLTGMHTLDLFQTERRHLDPEYQWPGSHVRGRWLRRCHKNFLRKQRVVKVAPCWVPMEPELCDLAREWLAEPGSPDARVVGPLNNINRTFEAAAARANLHRIRPNADLRASHSTMLLARGWSYEYVRIVLGHVGEVSGNLVEGHVHAVTAKRPTTLSEHYLRSHATPEHQHR